MNGIHLTDAEREKLEALILWASGYIAAENVDSSEAFKQQALSLLQPQIIA